MKPSRKPAGTLPLPRDRLKARKRSQMTWVSMFQQGNVAFAALMSSAQLVWKTFELAVISISPEKIVLLLLSLDSDVSPSPDTRSWVSLSSSKAENRKIQGANLPFGFARSSCNSDVSSSLKRTERYCRETPIFSARAERVKAAVPRDKPL